MRPQIQVNIEKDISRPTMWAVVIRNQEGQLLDTPARNMTKRQAHLCQLPIRRAFLSGMAWLREDSTSYILSINADVTCNIKETP